MHKSISEIIFNSISDGVFTVDKKCRITSFNKAAEQITGFTAREAVGKHCFDIFRTEICNKHCALKDTLKNEEPIENVRVTIISREGCEMPISVTTTLLRDENGRMVGAVEFFSDVSEIEHLKRHIDQRDSIRQIVSVNPKMQHLISLLPNIAQSGCNVLIQGPSGSGKELFANVLHILSQRKYGPYIQINCAALPATLLESELFGYEKGAFTDAKKDKPGQFCLANGGTLLLDEISEMDVSLQVKLLRVLNNGEYRPLGSSKTLHSDARIIAATNADLKKEIKRGNFREDLYYRINVVEINVPPLSKRPEDIPLLTDHFIKKFGLKKHKKKMTISGKAMLQLKKYPFPGNVRELENAIEHAFVMCGGDEILPEHLPSKITQTMPEAEIRPDIMSEKDMIIDAISRNRGNRSKAAAELGMHRTTLWRKIKYYNISE
ncbi:MAG: sigma-54 interaction domain-containing protein [Candidatus Kapaibacterium sp.]